MFWFDMKVVYYSAQTYLTGSAQLERKTFGNKCMGKFALAKETMLVVRLDFCAKLTAQINILTAQMASGKSIHLGSCNLVFNLESGQTNNFKIGIHSFPL